MVQSTKLDDRRWNYLMNFNNNKLMNHLLFASYKTLLKVHLNSKYFFRLEILYTFSKSIAPFLVLSCQMLAFDRLQNIRKSKHHLVHNQVRRGVGLFLI